MAGLCCAQGTIHLETEPTGQVTKVHGYDCYVASPPEGTQPKGVIIYIPDAFGWTLPNNRLLADAYARDGPFLIYLPEFMDGAGLPAHLMVLLKPMLDEQGFWASLKKLSILPWIAPAFVRFLYYARPPLAWPKIQDFAQKVRDGDETKGLPVGAAGFCWGGKFTFLLCGPQGKGKNGEPLVDCGFTAHPSLLAIPADAEAVERPISVAAADIDMQVTKPLREKLSEVLQKKTSSGTDCEFKFYEGASHGFAVRGDESDVARNRAEDAKAQAVKWFQKCFGDVKAKL